VLIGSGLALLYNSYSSQPVDFARYWPVALIVLGGEILLATARARQSGATVGIGLSGWALMGLVLVIVLGRGVTGPVIEGCSPLNWGYSGPFPHQVQRTTPLELDLTGIRTVVVDARFGNVDVSAVTGAGEPRGEAFITGKGRTTGDAEAAAAAAGPSVQRSGSRLTIRAEGERSDSRTSSASVSLVLALPADVELLVSSEFGAVMVTGLSGPVQATGRFGRISLSSLAGTVTAENEHGSVDAVGIAGPLSVRNTYGGVTCDDVVGPLNVDSRHGGVAIRRPGDRVRAETRYARVAVHYDQQPAGPCEVTSVHGPIVVEMPSVSAITLDAVSERSGVSSNLPGVQVRPEGRGNAAAGEVNGGGHSVRLRTEYARIDVRGR
jgi:hypothetical protein